MNKTRLKIAIHFLFSLHRRISQQFLCQCLKFTLLLHSQIYRRRIVVYLCMWPALRTYGLIFLLLSIFFSVKHRLFSSFLFSQLISLYISLFYTYTSRKLFFVSRVSFCLCLGATLRATVTPTRAARWASVVRAPSNGEGG